MTGLVWDWLAIYGLINLFIAVTFYVMGRIEDEDE